MKKSTKSTDIVTRNVTGHDAVMKMITNITARKDRPVLMRVS